MFEKKCRAAREASPVKVGELRRRHPAFSLA
jgi:hypothetical protein